ncbi:peptidoglycan-binding protein [Streptomyces sp. NPDC058662]|uniref:peptidoglycan-binding domain-containing protein n=1 Tax=Streptomyces sp. NPDC058662 TaxID=3346583 RepID=UPI0036588C4B
MTLPDPVEPDEPPVTGMVAPGYDTAHGRPHEIPHAERRGGRGAFQGSGEAAAPGRHDETPAYGVPVPPPGRPWPDAPPTPPRAADTVQLGTVPPGGAAPPGTVPPGGAAPPGAGLPGGAGLQERGTPFNRGRGGGGGGGPEGRVGSPSRRRLLLPLLLGGAATVALGGTALALWALPGSGDGGTARLDAAASAPPSSAAPAVPSPDPTAGPTGPSASPSASASASPSPSASRSASPSASPSPSVSSSSSASPSRTPSPSASRAPSSSPPRPAPGPTLRYGDSGAEVEKLQRLLAAEGLYQGRVHGKFDWRVENAVSTFQYESGIDDEEWGVYGPVTRQALEG